MFGAADYTLDMGMEMTMGGNELFYARSRIAIACRAADIAPPIDTPFMIDLKNTEALISDAGRAKELGFQGKLVIHPNQVEPCNKVFSPLPEEIKKAEKIVKAFEEAEAPGAAAIQLLLDERKLRPGTDLEAIVAANDSMALGAMQALQAQGLSVAGMKPVASGCERTPDGLRNDNAVQLQQQSSIPLEYAEVNPYAFEPAIAPHLAADGAGVTISTAQGTFTFPANFMLIAAMNPCDCSYFSKPDRDGMKTACFATTPGVFAAPVPAPYSGPPRRRWSGAAYGSL